MKRLAVTLRVVFAFTFLVLPLAGQGQQPAGRVYRIGVLDTSSPAASSARIGAFRRGLRELGHVEGQDIGIEWRFADGDELAFSGLAKELVGLKPDVLVSMGGEGLGA